MKQITRSILMALMLFFLSDSLSAQYTYIVDALRSDSTALYPFDAKWNTDGSVHLGDKVGMLPNGTEVLVAANDTVVDYVYFKSVRKGKEIYSGAAAITYKGKKYLVAADDLVMGENNPAGVRDFINKEENYHTQLGHWYSTMTPYIYILVLMLLTTIFAAIAQKAHYLSILVPILMVGALAIEIFAVKTLGSDALWWIDPDLYPMGKIILRLVMFAAVVIMQIFSIRLFQNAVGGNLSFKGPLIGIIVAVGIFILSLIVAMFWRHSAESIVNTGLILGGVSILIGILVTAIQNIKQIGFISGIALSIFAIVYCVGLLIAVVMLVIGIITAFLEMIVTIGGGILVLMIMSKIVPSREYTRADGTRVEVYEDFHV